MNLFKTTSALLGATLSVSPMLAQAERPDDWTTATPETFGLSTAAFDAAARNVKKIPLRYCMSVVKNGQMIYDRAFIGQPNARYYAFSVTKTLGAVLVGVAENQGLLSADDKVLDWLGAVPKGMNPAATIRDVLGQVSQSDPLGTQFSYSSGTRIDTLGRILTVATGMPSDDYASKALFEPLGMTYSSWQSDKNGNIKIGVGVTSTCRDLARVGQLLLDGGVWRDQRLLSSDYVDAMTQPSYPAANSNYGYLTWLNWSEGPWHRPLTSGTGLMVKNAPRNAYFATGFFGQLIIVVPDEDIVITTLGTTLRLETLGTLQKVWDAVAPALEPTPP